MKILIVDDEREFVQVLKAAFEVYRPGYSVIAAYDGSQALAAAREEQPDLVVLDVMLPDMSGFDVCRALRSQGYIPIILLTARDREEDVVQGLSLGADDYVTKPCSYRELMARIDAVLRRVSQAAQQGDGGRLEVGDLIIDFTQRQVMVRGSRVSLTPKEYAILERLARNVGQPVSHEELLATIWGPAFRDEPQYLKTYIYRLRRKIEENPRCPRYILTYYRVGYRLAMESRPAAAGAGGKG